jgi:hypothetical protein
MLFMPLRSAAFAQVLLRKTGCFATPRLAGKTTHSDANCCCVTPAIQLQPSIAQTHAGRSTYVNIIIIIMKKVPASSYLENNKSRATVFTVVRGLFYLGTRPQQVYLGTAA